jgi:dimethylamine---corrinoid protein Co-methyltransferase
MPDNIITRMGNGARVELSPEQVKADILAGTLDAADRGKIPQLDPDELDQLFEIYADPNRVVSVKPGDEVITTDDSAALSLVNDQADGGVGIPMSSMQSVLTFERVCCADTAGVGHIDYSCKPVKPIINYEKQMYYSMNQVTTIPLIYGTQPNLGQYFQPDGPFPNPSELLPARKIKEAMAAQEEAADQLRNDLVFVASNLYEVGCDGFNFDTAASAGDADFLAALEAIRELKEVAPLMAIELGMASEFVLGLHGEVTFDDQRLAGMYPHKQVKMAEAAGADIFGPAVNVKATKSIPWNLARAVTFVKETVKVANIPVHANVGMGVCGLPLYEAPPIDCTTRAAKALVEIGKADGL